MHLLPSTSRMRKETASTAFGDGTNTECETTYATLATQSNSKYLVTVLALWPAISLHGAPIPLAGILSLVFFLGAAMALLEGFTKARKAHEIKQRRSVTPLEFVLAPRLWIVAGTING